MRILMHYILYDCAPFINNHASRRFAKTPVECENTSMYSSTTLRTHSGPRSAVERFVKYKKTLIDLFSFQHNIILTYYTVLMAIHRVSTKTGYPADRAKPLRTLETQESKIARNSSSNNIQY